MKEWEQTDNISVEELLDTIEYMIISNPEMVGVEIDDSKGRSWYITQTNDEHSIKIN